MAQRYLLGQSQRRVLGIQSKASVYAGQAPTEQGTALAPAEKETKPASTRDFIGALTTIELEELQPWLFAVTLGSTGNTDLAGGYLAADVVKIHDDDDSHELSLVWNEAEASANRTLNLLVHGQNRTLDLTESLTVAGGSIVTLQALGQANSLILNESLTVGDGNDGTVTFSGASKTLTVEGNAIVSQDYSSDASPTFANVSLGTGELTTGSINRASGTLTLEIGGSAKLSIASSDVTLADGVGLNLQEDITFGGATTENLVKFPDVLADALSFKEGANPYLTFVTTNGSEAVKLGKNLIIPDAGNIGSASDTDAIAISAGGIVDITSQSRARGYLNTTQDVERAVYTKVLLDAEDYDAQSEFSTANNKFTTTNAGYYAVVGHVTVAESIADQTVIRILIYVDGAEYSRHSFFTSVGSILHSVLISDVVYAAASKDIELYFWFNDPVGNRELSTGSANTWMAIHKLS